MTTAEDAIAAAVLLASNDDYTEEGIHEWWQAYRVADQVTRKRMLLHLRVDTMAAQL